MIKSICIVTGTRAEYGLLRPLIEEINNRSEYKLKLVVTGMHLSPEFGFTYREIESDGYTIDEKIEILMSSDTSVGTTKSMALAMISFSEYFNRTKPDLLIILGDRYEIFSVATAATLAHIPIAHLHGGETTEGAYDEVFRHSITKMSYLHFASTTEYANRIIQLGEEKDRVFDVGAIGVENIMKIKLMSLPELENSINFKLDKPFGLVTFHPVTLEDGTSEAQVRALLRSLDKFKDMKFIITKANSDSDGRIINKILDEYYENNKHRVILFTSMGQLRYLSAMKYCSMVIGNSSSGIIEAPTYGIPTINIGDRQKGRIQAISVINCNPIESEITAAINRVLDEEYLASLKGMKNPYGDGETVSKIMIQIDYLLSKNIDLKKKFYDLNKEDGADV